MIIIIIIIIIFIFSGIFPLMQVGHMAALLIIYRLFLSVWKTAL